MHKVLILSQLLWALPAEAGSLTCQKLHQKAISACTAHEHALNADALTIVSTETRGRVIRSEENKLQSVKSGCLKAQRQCAMVCDEELELASLDGNDVTQPIERLNDCRQGNVATQLKAMSKKISELRRVMSTQDSDLKSAAIER